MYMSKQMTNKEIAALLMQMAAAYEIKDMTPYRTRAYQNAAVSIENRTTPLRESWDRNALTKVPGIGPSIAQHLDELFKTGIVKHFQQEVKNMPQGMFALLSVPGIGPKTAHKLAKRFKLNHEETAVQQLLFHAEHGEIRSLEDFGEKSESDILKGLNQVITRKDRMLLVEGQQISEEILAYLRKNPKIIEAEALGSVRRKSPTVGDVDIAVASNYPNEVMTYISRFPSIKRILATGENTTRFIHSSGKQIDIKTQSPREWGSTLQHYTGSKLHNIRLRTFALKKGLSLSEYGIKKESKILRFTNEKDFYHALGLDFIPPELREDTGEIEASQKHALPKLVSLTDVKGDFHLHTNIDISSSHDMGHNSTDEILQKAVELGYSYIGFADHNPKLADLTADERFDLIKKRNEIIDKSLADFNAHNNYRIHMLKGLEVDIRPNGDLALEDKALNLLDYVIASVHSQFDQPQTKATKRVLTALSHPKVKILGHPTGRILQQRQGLEYDWDALFNYCHTNHKILEINASPFRLDLPEVLVKQAVTKKVMMIINTDSHRISEMELMKYGVWNARRGWAEKINIVNTWNLSQVKEVFFF